MMVLIASSISANAQQKNRDRYFDDFRGQSFCGKRQRTPEGTCCASRYDECSVPIAGEVLGIEDKGFWGFEGSPVIHVEINAGFYDF
jgi:hypothetical protein